MSEPASWTMSPEQRAAVAELVRSIVPDATAEDLDLACDTIIVARLRAEARKAQPPADPPESEERADPPYMIGDSQSWTW